MGDLLASAATAAKSFEAADGEDAIEAAATFLQSCLAVKNALLDTGNTASCLQSSACAARGGREAHPESLLLASSDALPSPDGPPSLNSPESLSATSMVSARSCSGSDGAADLNGRPSPSSRACPLPNMQQGTTNSSEQDDVRQEKKSVAAEDTEELMTFAEDSRNPEIADLLLSRSVDQLPRRNLAVEFAEETDKPSPGINKGSPASDDDSPTSSLLELSPDSTTADSARLGSADFHSSSEQEAVEPAAEGGNSGSVPAKQEASKSRSSFFTAFSLFRSQERGSVQQPNADGALGSRDQGALAGSSAEDGRRAHAVVNPMFDATSLLQAINTPLPSDFATICESPRAAGGSEAKTPVKGRVAARTSDIPAGSGERLAPNAQSDSCLCEDSEPEQSPTIFSNARRRATRSRRLLDSSDEEAEAPPSDFGSSPGKQAHGSNSEEDKKELRAGNSESRSNASSPIQLSSDSGGELEIVFTRAQAGGQPALDFASTSESGSGYKVSFPGRKLLPRATPLLEKPVLQKPSGGAAFRRVRERLTSAAFQEFNVAVFASQLDPGMEVRWSKTLQTTAGKTFSRRAFDGGSKEPRYLARIELSDKVCDSEERLRSTLLHEMCHAASWTIDHHSGPPHGPNFRKWAARCGKVVRRHTNSVDLATTVCGACGGKLDFLGRFNKDGTPAAKRAPTQYSMFVKENYGAVKEQHPPDTPGSTVMRALARQWQHQKQESGRTPMRELADGQVLDKIASWQLD